MKIEGRGLDTHYLNMSYPYLAGAERREGPVLRWGGGTRGVLTLALLKHAEEVITG